MGWVKSVVEGRNSFSWVHQGWCFMGGDGSGQVGYICHSFYVDVVRVQVLFLYIDNLKLPISRTIDSNTRITSSNRPAK